MKRDSSGLTPEQIDALTNWMKYNWDVIKDRPIWDIVIPGTHNSGSYSAGNTGYVRNQTHDIGKQLEYGIRSFDIRVKKRPNGKYVMFHATYPPGPKQQLFQDALDQIKDFASKHPHEILIIYIDGFRHDSHEEQITFQDLYINYLKDYLVVLDVDRTSRHIERSSYTPAKMYDTKKNIIIISELRTDPTVYPPEIQGRLRQYQWKTTYTDTYVSRGSWDNRQTFPGVLCDITPLAKVKFLEKHIPGWLKGDQDFPANRTGGCDGTKQTQNKKEYWIYRGNYFNWASATIWTPEIIADTLNILHPRLDKWVTEWQNDPAIMERLGIIGIDAAFSTIGVFPVIKTLIPNIIAMNEFKSK